MPACCRPLLWNPTAQQLIGTQQHNKTNHWNTLMELPMQEVVHVLLKAHKKVMKDCSAGKKWMELALRQGGDWKETFGEILYDLQWLCSILCKQVGEDRQVLELADCDRTLCETEINTLLTAAKKDEEDLEDLLRYLQGDHFCSVSGCGIHHGPYG